MRSFMLWCAAGLIGLAAAGRAQADRKTRPGSHPARQAVKHHPRSNFGARGLFDPVRAGPHIHVPQHTFLAIDAGAPYGFVAGPACYVGPTHEFVTAYPSPSAGYDLSLWTGGLPENYGLPAIARLLGIAPQPPLPLAGGKAATDQAARQAGETEKAFRPRRSNQQARDRAARYLAIGDKLFAEQRFHEALQRYKSAAAAAPDLAESYFRQGHALIATHRYKLAAAAFKRALQIYPDLRRGGFQLDDLYQDNRLAKASHQEALAKAALEEQRNSDLMFLLAVTLHYDGAPKRAEKFFARAAQLSKSGREHLRPFVPATKSAPAVPVSTDGGVDL